MYRKLERRLLFELRGVKRSPPQKALLKDYRTILQTT